MIEPCLGATAIIEERSWSDAKLLGDVVEEFLRNVLARPQEIGRAHVGTPVTNAHIVCRLLLEKKKSKSQETGVRLHVEHTRAETAMQSDVQSTWRTRNRTLKTT